MSALWHQLPREPPLARFIPETKKNVAPLCGQMRIFFCDARPRPPASDYKCGGKSNIVGQVPSRARKTLTFEALQNSKRGNWHLASTKHLLLIMLEFRFAKFRGISTFQFCETFVTNLVSQLSGSGHLGNLGLSWLGFAWLTWLGLAWPSRFWLQTGSPEDAKPILAPCVTNDFADLWLGRDNRTQPYIYTHHVCYTCIYNMHACVYTLYVYID